MELKDLVGKFADNAGIERAPSVGGVWKFSADGNEFVARGFMSV